jgi:hypothetical protein
MPTERNAHDKAVEQVENVFPECKCLKHANLGGVEPDLTCICSPEPLNIMEIETPKSVGTSHTKKQAFLMSRLSERGNDNYGLIIADGKKMCGIPINSKAKQMFRERKIPVC